jgi:PTH1 family peptidyl-tRNA hydrolase
MNRSGLAVRALVERFEVPLDALLVVHDDLDLPLGALRVRASGGHGGHNGLRSILDALGSGEFPRVKVGIGRPAGKGQVVDHVLSPFDPDEEPLVPPLLERAADAAEAVGLEGPLLAMNRFNG